MSGVRIPISADAASVTTALDRIREAIRRAGQEAREFSKLDLSHPELKDFAEDIRRMQDNLQRLTQDARGATAATARRVYDGSGGRLWGPGGLLDPTRWQQVRPDDWQRQHTNAGRYILQGTGVFTAQQPPQPQGGGGSIPLPGVPSMGQMAQSATSSAMAMMRGFIPAMLAMAGLQSLGRMAGEAVSSAGDEAIANDRLLRTLRDASTDFDGLRTSVRDAARGLGITYEEAQRVASVFTTMASHTDGRTIGGEARFAMGFARGYGMDPSQVAGGFGRAAFLGEDPRRFAGIMAEAIQGANMTGRPAEVMETLLRFQEQNARRFGPANALEHFAGAYATLSSSGIPGLRGAGAEAILGQIDSAVRQGGAAGDASQYFTWRALSRHGVSDVFQQQYALAGGMFAGVNGGAAGPGNPTNIEAMMQEAERIYGSGPAGRFRRFHAVGRHLGLDPRQYEAWEQARSSAGWNGLNRVLSGMNLQASDLNATSIRDAAAIADPRANLDEWRTNITRRLASDDPQRQRLAGLQGEELRQELIRTLISTGRETTQGSRWQESIANFGNQLTELGTRLLTPLTDIRNFMAGAGSVLNAIAENIQDGFAALLGNPEARARLMGRIGGPGGPGAPGQVNMPGGMMAPTAMSDPQRAEAARALYQEARAAGYSHEHASAIVAQVDAESGFNPTLSHERDGRGFGLLGWNNDGERAGRAGRLTNMGIFVAQRRGLPMPGTYAEATALARTATAAEQRAFLLHEIGPGGAEHRNAANFRQAQTAGEAAAALSRDVVRPADRVGNMQRRGRLAEQYSQTFRPQGVDRGEVYGPPAPGADAAAAPPAAPAPARGEQHSFMFSPGRIVLEDPRGTRLGETWLDVQPSTGGGAPMPWGVA